MKVLVIGSGMGGMCAAIALKIFGHDVEVYERFNELRPAGAAISVWSNGVKCLNFLGLGRQAQELGGDMAHVSYRDGHTGETMCRFSLDALVEEVGQKPYPMSRHDLQGMLHDEFGRGQIQMGKELVSVEDDGALVTAYFSDGSTATGDVLIGADGTHSRVREHVLGHAIDRRYAGYVNYNGLVAATKDLAPLDQWTTWVGEGKRVSLMPVAGDRFYFFFDVPLPVGLPNERGRYRGELREHFAGWAPEVQLLVDRLDPQSTNRVEIHDIDPWHEWVRGRVALLGDAAHSTTPDIGQGGCQAMEDAVALAIALQVNTVGIEDALHRYAKQRSPRAAELVLRARKRSEVTHGADPRATSDWYGELREETGERVIGGIVKNIVGSPLG